MIIRTFKNFSPFNFILIIFIAIIFWGYSLVIGNNLVMPDISNQMPLYINFCNFIFGLKLSFFPYLISFLFIIAQLIIITNLDSVYSFSRSRNFFSGLVFILFSSFIVIINVFSPLLIANIFVLLAIKRVFSAYNKEKILSNFFDASLLISLASMFYFYSIFLIFFLLISTLIYKSTPFKEWIAIFIAILITYAVYIEFYFIFYGEIKSLYEAIRTTFNKVYENDFSQIIFIISLVVFTLVSLLSFLNYLQTNHTFNVNIRVFFRLSIILFIIISLIFIFTKEFNYELILFTIFPISIHTSNYLINVKRKRLAELFFLTIVLAIVFVHVYTFLGIN